jgi:hypothetical protein
MTTFKISSEVAELLPSLQVVVVVAKGLDNRTVNPNIATHAQVSKLEGTPCLEYQL